MPDVSIPGQEPIARRWRSLLAHFGVPWTVAVGATWLLSTIALAALVRHGLAGRPAGIIAHSAATCLVGCVAIGGPATLTALVLRARLRPLTAVACGIAVGAAAFAIVAACLGPRYALLTAVAPVALVVAVEVTLAFRLLAWSAVRRGWRRTA